MLSEATQTEIRIQRKLEAAGGNVSYAGRCILDLAAALDAKQRELDTLGPVEWEASDGTGWRACSTGTALQLAEHINTTPGSAWTIRAIRVVREESTHAH